MHAMDWTIVFCINGAIIAYGFWLARGTTTSVEWFLGRRSLPWWAIGLSMFATNIDNADLVSICGKTYSSGLHILTVYTIGSAFGSGLAAFAVVPAIYRAGLYTNAEYLEFRFGVVTRVLSALIQIQYRSVMLGLMLWAVYLLLRGLDLLGPTEAWILIVGLTVCAGVYTAWGGLKSVVWTDALQAIVMFLGGVIIFVTVWRAVGGWDGMLSAFESHDAQHESDLKQLVHIGSYDGGEGGQHPFLVGGFNFGPYVVALGWTIIGCGYWTVNHTQTMRLLGARSVWDMQMAAIMGVVFSLPMTILMALLGILGRGLPEFRNLDYADQIYPRLADAYLGVGWKGLVVASVVAATVSTVDSMGSALSAVFTRDIYARLIAPNRDDDHYVFVGRWATMGILLLGYAYLPFIVLQRSMLDALTTLIPVFVTPLFVVYLMGVFTKAHRRSAVCGLAVGGAYGLFALYVREASRLGLPDVQGVSEWLTNRWIAFAWSIIITSATMGVVTLFMGRSESTEDQTAESENGWLAASRRPSDQICAHPFETHVPWWADPRLYALALVVGSLTLVFLVFW